MDKVKEKQLDNHSEPHPKKQKLIEDTKSPSESSNEDRYPEWTVKASECINVILGRNEEDFEKKTTTFHPNFTHQIFQDEKIVGYKGLVINMFYSPGFDVQIETTFSEKSEKETGPIADDVFKILGKSLPKGQPINDRNNFLKVVRDQDSSFRPSGNLIYSYSIQNNNSTTFEIWKAHLCEEEVKSFHEKVEIFLLFFIDGASYIDLEDPAWDVYYVYSKTENNKQVKYSLVGFSTVYTHYAYPDRKRMRISQVLILPPYQKSGHGAHLLKSIYKIAHDTNAKDVTVEDASPDFSKVRDFVDVQYLLNSVPFFQQNPMMQLDKKAIDALREETKLCAEQLKYCYDLVSYRNLNKHHQESVKAFRLQMKRKLFKKYEDILSQYENLDDKKKELQVIYSELEKRFSDTLSKLDKKA